MRGMTVPGDINLCLWEAWRTREHLWWTCGGSDYCSIWSTSTSGRLFHSKFWCIRWFNWYRLTEHFFVYFSWPSSIVSAWWNCNTQWDINHRFFTYHIESPLEWIRRTILFIFKGILVSVHGPWKWAHKSSNLERKFNLIRRPDGDLNLPALTQKVFQLSYHRPFWFWVKNTKKFHDQLRKRNLLLSYCWWNIFFENNGFVFYRLPHN